MPDKGAWGEGGGGWKGGGEGVLMGDLTAPMWSSTVCRRVPEEGASIRESSSFSTPSTTPSTHLTPMEVLQQRRGQDQGVTAGAYNTSRKG